MSNTSNSEEHHPELRATKARQGRFGRHMFWVLLISTVAAAIALLATWGLRSDDLAATEPANARQPADAAVFEAPTPAPVQRPQDPDAPGFGVNEAGPGADFHAEERAATAPTE